MLNGLMKIPGNVSIAELQLGAVSSQIASKAVRKTFLPGPGDTGRKQVVLNLMLWLNKSSIQPRKCGSWEDGRLQRFILLHAKLPLPC